jgi:hypothetical protein
MPCYPNRVGHERKIRSRKKRTDIGKYSFVNRSMQLWNQLPADALGTIPVNQVILERGLGK